MNLIKILFPTKETQTADGVQLWTVEWTKRYGRFNGDTTQAFQAFISQSDAEAFADSLRTAFKLIGHTSQTSVSVYKQKNGL